MTDSKTEATVYERLRRRSVLLAWLWALSGCCRLSFALVTFLFPGIILVFLVSEAAKRSIAEVYQLLGEWQLYACMVTVSAIAFILWRWAERFSKKLLQSLDGEPA